VLNLLRVSLIPNGLYFLFIVDSINASCSSDIICSSSGISSINPPYLK
jgi:hypothetical protein